MSSTPFSRPHLTTIPSAPSAAREEPARLPAPLTSLVGRERELAELAALTGNPDVRLAAIAEPPMCADAFSGQLIPATKWIETPGTLVGTGGMGSLYGGAGDDRIRTVNGTADGDSGDDTITGLFPVALLGGSGRDSVNNLRDDANPRIDCGSGSDVVHVGGSTDVRGCERTF